MHAIEYPELGECRVARELNFTRIYTSILSNMLTRMHDDYESREVEERHIRRLTWRAFRAAGLATGLFFDQRFFDRRFIGDSADEIEQFNSSVEVNGNGEAEQ